MDLLAPVKVVDHFQQRHRPLAVLAATIKKFSEDRSGNLVALLAYYAFLSLFPLLLVLVTVLGYVLSGNPHLLHQIEDSILGRFPVIGSSLNTGKLKGSAFALVVGIVLSLWSGLAITQSAQHAFNRVWEVPQGERPNFWRSKLRGLAILVVFGTLLLTTSAISAAVGGGVGNTFSTCFGLTLSFVLNLLLLLASYRVLCSAEIPYGALLPGAVIGALAWLALQTLAGVYIAHIQHSSNTYGTFALVIGVLAWLHVGLQVTIYCNTLNVVLVRDRWPRSLLGPEHQVVPRRDGLDEAQVVQDQRTAVI